MIIAGGFAEVFVRQGLTVGGNAAATAQNILEHEGLFRLGIIADLLTIVCTIILSLIFFMIFKPVNKWISLLALIFSTVACSVMAANLLNQIGPLLLLQKSSYAAAFNSGQLQTLSLYFLQLQSQGYGISLLLFAFYFPLIGWLVFKSGFIPKFIGILYALAGAGYLLNSLVMFLSPSLLAHLFPYVLLPAFIGEVSMAFWLIIKGVKTI
jgi:hypothetical protein